MGKTHLVSRSLSVLTAAVVCLFAATAFAEIVHLKSGDVVTGNVTSVTSQEITLQTPYGRLKIPKKDILRIEYKEGETSKPTEKKPAAKKKPSPAKVPAKKEEKTDLSDWSTTRPAISMDIRGRSFWYAFVSPTESPADVSIRLRIFLGEKEAAMLLDTKPDTVDGTTYYNSFTFSPTDSKVIRTGSGFDCAVSEAEDGRVALRLQLPEAQSAGQYLVRMLYQINEGDRQFPRWIDAVSRAFTIEIMPGKESQVTLEQDASALDYSGFFRKSMKNVESFRLEVLSAELKDLSPEP